VAPGGDGIDPKGSGRGNKPPVAELGIFQIREVTMTIAKIIWAGAAAMIISSAAWADEELIGRVIKMDPANGKITLEHRLAGTVGAAGGNTFVDEYSLQNDVAFKGLKVGDPVSFTASQIGGVWSVTRLQKH
jgi:Cu/Ag efflux protein CusF